MDEEEKPFPIEYFVIFFLIAAANDIARAFFLLLDFTGVGVSGEAIMEPANAVLDFFFIGVFRWRTKSFAGSTMTQYGGGILEFVAPVRMLSVGIGMYLANNPNSIFGKIATTAASIESGNIGGIEGEAEGAVGKAEGAANAEKKIENEGAGAEGAPKTTESDGAITKPTAPEGESTGENEGAPENDIFKNPYDNPVGTAQEEEFNPSEDAIQEGKGFGNGEEPQEDSVQPQSGIHVVSRRPPAPPKQSLTENAGDKELDKAA